MGDQVLNVHFRGAGEEGSEGCQKQWGKVVQVVCEGRQRTENLTYSKRRQRHLWQKVVTLKMDTSSM